MKIWQRTLAFDLLKTLTLVYLGLFSLFVMLDYAVHMKELVGASAISMMSVVYYYACHTSKYLAVLLPLALLIATIKVLNGMSQKRELLALQAGGVSLKRIGALLLSLALLISGLMWINFEYWMPGALKTIDRFDMRFFHKGKKREPNLFTVPLEDGTKLYYAHRDLEKLEVYDAFWIRSSDDIYRIKTLHLQNRQGDYVDHITRDDEGNLSKSASYEHLTLDLHLETLERKNFFVPFQARSMSQLYGLLHHPQHARLIQTHFIYKCLAPLTAILIILALLAPATRYRRSFNPFGLYALSFFGFIGLYAILNASIILGESSLGHPYLMTIPIGLPLIHFGARFKWL